MTDKRTAIDVMAMAIEQVLFPVQCQDFHAQTLQFEECKRAARTALLAFAGMPPTPTMDEAAERELENEDLHCAWDIVKAGICAAANEGREVKESAS